MSIRDELRRLASPARAKVSQSFFRTGPGEYGEGDVFWGIAVPEIRRVAKRNSAADIDGLRVLLRDQVHECRLCALLVLREQYGRATAAKKEFLVNFYLENAGRVNNWDLVDSSAPYILGDWLLNRERSVLFVLAGSKSLWERRIAVVATYAFIRNNDFADTLRLCERLMGDPHDLMHKACGWMLREVGKRDENALTGFLEKHAKTMPRTMLRYAIERLSPARRQHFMRRDS
ncbi:DNA alkylation repair protein [Candidatus Woesearchaeota archaeon]|nr:MAG: DNA alkylation repair protein [Candidatus Woesearchaeota archaeon]